MHEDNGKVSFKETKGELFETVNIPSQFTINTRLGRMYVHLDTPQWFFVEMYVVYLNVPDAAEDQDINITQETLHGISTH